MKNPIARHPWSGAAALALLLTGAVAVPAAPTEATFRDHNGRIAFRRYLNEERTWAAVFTIEPDGNGERQVTFPPQGVLDVNPDVSPDGRRIAFERRTSDCNVACTSDEVFVVNVGGSGLTQLTDHPGDSSCDHGGACNGSPAWSPEGTQIAFERASGPVIDGTIEEVGIYVANADGSGLHQITQKARPALGEDTNAQWSPDGRKLVFQRFNVRTAEPADGVALWIVNLRTGRERQLTPFDLRAGDTPDWSPDGKRILFHDNQGGPSNISANLYTIRADGTDLRQLTFATGGVTQYLGSSYSPDGKMIVFGRRPETGGVNADVFTMRVDGTGERAVTRTELYDSNPDWGPAPDDDAKKRK
jgi:Tol biopolymer transport system component